MAINFTDSPANGATQTISGRTYTYNSAKNKWDTTATEVAGPTATTYATVNDLPGTATAGDQAFVSGTNRLYIWNGSGWYNIALINNTPTWTTQPASSYALEIDGTATVVSIVASDPEGLPITYSITSDTSGNVATVVQGTGLNTNSWTITPSTSNADAGTFSLTFRASDGINIASAISSFTLQFKVVNQKYTTALITSVGANNAVNNSFDDKSTNDHTITAAGNATQTTFSPYRHGGYSTYFDGSGDYIQPAGTTIFDIPSSTASFTVEAWINPPALPSAGAYNYRFGSIISKAVVYVSFGFTSNGTLRFYTYSGAENYINSASGVIEAGKWQHVALVSNAGSITLYKDGVSVATGTLVAPAATGIGVAPKIATADTGQAADFINSYISDLRVVDGTAVYTSAFTPPTERLTAITNTSLLTCHLPYIADGSTTGHAITVNGNTSTQPFAPYDEQEYSAADHGGSAFFDGSGDYLSIASGSHFADFGTDDFTVEWWEYITGWPTQYFSIFHYGSLGDTSNFNANLGIRYEGSGAFIRIGISGATVDFTGLTTPLNVWRHCAIVRSGTTATLYRNGKVDGSATLSNNITQGTGQSIIGGAYFGGGNGSLYSASGFINDLRVAKNSTVYTSAFTPPTAPLTAITNTSLLLNGTDAAIIDKSQSVKSLTLNGDVKSSTTQTKYLSSSMYFDGTGDYVQTNTSDLYNIGTGQFTAECWMNVNDDTQHSLFYFMNSGVNNLGVFYYHVNNSLGVYDSNWITGNAGSGSNHNVLTVGQWHHVAISRDSTTLRAFVDGTIVHSVSNSTNYSCNNIRLGDNQYTGSSLHGYISDFRFTKGLARYTANFTPPTAALQG